MEKLLKAVEKNAEFIKKSQDYLWTIPEPGYKEFKTNAYMMENFERLGYVLKKPENITGFSTEIDTGRPGPTVAICAELDALYSEEHPATSKETGCVHACGHHIQCAGMLGIAAALKEDGVLDELCGKIRLIVVPAEEGIEISYRLGLIKQGIIEYSSGKPEFVKRGFFDGVDICYMVHAENLDRYKEGAIYHVGMGGNGVIRKTTIIKGKAAHAGGAPHLGVNALNAANFALSAVNNLRETFRDDDHIRFHSIITKGGSSVNVVPDEVIIESYVRGATSMALKEANEKINRAMASACAVFGATIQINDLAGSEPQTSDLNLRELAYQTMKEIVGEEKSSIKDEFLGSSTDMGDITQLFPGIHSYVGGMKGVLHGKDFEVVDQKASENSSKFQVGLLYNLLKDDAKRAKYIIANFKPTFAGKEEYLAHKQSMNACIEGVTYCDDGKAIIKYKK